MNNNFGFRDALGAPNNIRLSPDNLPDIYDLKIPEKLPNVKEDQIKEIDGTWILLMINQLRETLMNIPHYQLPPLLNSYDLKDLDKNIIDSIKEIFDYDVTLKNIFCNDSQPSPQPPPPQQFNNSTIQQSNNPTLQQFNNSTTQQFQNLRLQQFNHSTIQQINNSAIQQFNDSTNQPSTI